MRLAWRRWTRISVLGLLLAVPGSELLAQDEPILDGLRDAISSEALTLRVLLQTHLDAGIEDAPTKATVRAARVRLGGSLDRGFSYVVQTDFARAPAVIDARLGWTSSSGISVYAGRFKTPFSGEFLTPLATIDFVRRARVVRALAPNRQIGIQVGGTLDGLISVTAGGFTGGSNQVQNEALAGIGRIATVPLSVADGELTLAGQVAVGRDAAIAGPNGSGFEGDGMIVGVDGRFESGRLLLAGEFIHGDWDPVFPSADVTSDGISATAGWAVMEGHRALARWDRYRAPGGDDDDLLVLGYNLLPISAVELQLNWSIPLSDGGGPHAVLANLEVGF